jgi:hypothetical protein
MAYDENGLKLRWLTWPVQVPRASNFSITGFESPFKTYDSSEGYDREFRGRHTSGSPSTYTAAGAHSQSPPSDQQDIKPQEANRLTYRKALSRWLSVLQTPANVPDPAKYLSISKAKQNSYRLLREWWYNDSYDGHIAALLREWIEQAASLDISIALAPRMTRSRYNSLLLTLWRAEFGGGEGDEGEVPASDGDLYNERNMTAAEAACHRVAACIPFIPFTIPIPSRFLPTKVATNDEKSK